MLLSNKNILIESNNEEDNKEVDETAEKSETDPDQLLGDQHDQQFIDEWMQRLQEQGLIRGDNTLELGDYLKTSKIYTSYLSIANLAFT